MLGCARGIDGSSTAAEVPLGSEAREDISAMGGRRRERGVRTPNTQHEEKPGNVDLGRESRIDYMKTKNYRGKILCLG